MVFNWQAVITMWAAIGVVSPALIVLLYNLDLIPSSRVTQVLTGSLVAAALGLTWIAGTQPTVLA